MGRVTAFDRDRPERLLGVDYSESDFDFYGTQPTALGRDWGLSGGWLSANAVAVSDGIDVLGLDDTRAGQVAG